jgi:3'(2'), 5'-bisphosphate nucleotidase
MLLSSQSASPSDCAAIRQLITTGGDYAYQQSQRAFQVFEKGVDDYVTSVDRDVDQQLLEGFRARFPNDGVITEENRTTLQRFNQPYERFWFIDPIDGTDDFINGKANYAVMVGQVIDGQPQAGWIYAPAHGSLYWGGPNRGLFCQHRGDPPQPLLPVEPSLGPSQAWSMVIGDKDWRRFGDAIANHLPGVTFFSLGSFGLKVLAVIRGQAGMYIYLNGRVKLWDTTGPLALALAAGLTCCDLNGQSIQFSDPYVDPETMVHRQPILVGWPSYINRFRPLIKQAVASIPQPSPQH